MVVVEAQSQLMLPHMAVVMVELQVQLLVLLIRVVVVVDILEQVVVVELVALEYLFSHIRFRKGVLIE
jgi:hypothetical protein